ncbi:hypothetical protein GCM10008967_22580 [Bacillus carboniphilus]|uniref:Uncharacterized protein n=1 Tax=Bacillus carboniphilus TaxID=86663 RepID=A0ABN0WBZ0_9BACI
MKRINGSSGKWEEGTRETPQERRGTKAKNATSCGNAFVTNILLARGGSRTARGKQAPTAIVIGKTIVVM